MKKIISLGMVVAMMFTMCATSAFASSSAVKISTEKAKFSVTVPTAMPIAVKADGTVIGGNANIVNDSAAPIKINAINMTAASGWTLVDGDTDLKNEIVGSKKLGLVINNIVGKADGTFDIADEAFPVVVKGDKGNLTWSGVATVFSSEVSETTAATVEYTVGFAN